MKKKTCGKNDIWFLRWGNLNPVKHKEARGANEDTWIHVAPCYKGIYAFPRGYVELFLIGGSYGMHHKKYLKYNGERVLGRDFYDSDGNIKKEYINLMRRLNIKKSEITDIDRSEEEWYIAYHEKPKHFTYKGDIWHHLDYYVDKKDIKDSRHGWCKTSYEVYIKALHKCDVCDRFTSYMRDNERHGNPHTYPNREMKDFYEVFIEKIK